MSILETFDERISSCHSMLCVGLDSRVNLLSPDFLQSDTPQLDFNRWIIDQTAPYAAAFKLNTAFYEARGAQGWAEMAATIDYLNRHHPQAITICDAKRADIGSTNEGYVKAVFDDLGFDAITLHPYLGHEAMQPFLQRNDHACIVLCRTSNPGSGEFQSLDLAGRPLWQHVALTVRDEWNKNNNCMLVIGATYPDDLRRARLLVGDTLPFLVPGVGAQGGDVKAVVQNGVDSRGRGLLINASRSIIFADDPENAARTLRDQINGAR